MTTVLAFINALIFSLLGGIHIYWGLGGKWGSENALPQNPEKQTPLFLPGIVACFIVALGLLGMAFFTLQQIGFLKLDLPFKWIANSSLYVISIILMLRAIGDFKYVGFFKKIHNTAFGRLDTQFYSPLCLFLSITSFLIKISDTL